MGYSEEYNISRYFRESRLMKIAPVSQEMILNFLGSTRARLAEELLMTDPLFDLTGRSALVTGSGRRDRLGRRRGAGRRRCRGAGHRCRRGRAAAVAERICANGGKAESAALDVRDRAAADAAAAQAGRPGRRCAAHPGQQRRRDRAGDVRRPHRRELPRRARHPRDGGRSLRPGRAAVPARPTAPDASST